MRAMDDYLEFKRNLAYPPTPEGFRTALKQMTGGVDAPESAVIEFGGMVCRLFFDAVREWHNTDAWQPALEAGLSELSTKGTLCGWDPAAYGYRIDISQHQKPKETVN